MNVRKVYEAGLCLLATIVVVGTFVLWYQSVLTRHQQGPISLPAQDPRLQIEFESGKLQAELKAKQLARLKNIDQAMDEVVKKGSLEPSVLFSGGGK